MGECPDLGLNRHGRGAVPDSVVVVARRHATYETGWPGVPRVMHTHGNYDCQSILWWHGRSEAEAFLGQVKQELANCVSKGVLGHTGSGSMLSLGRQTFSVSVLQGREGPFHGVPEHENNSGVRHRTCNLGD